MTNPALFRRRSALIGTYLFLTLFVLVAIGPILMVWFSALKSNPEIASSPIGLPESFRWGNLADAWTTGRFGTYFANSALIGVVTTSAVIICAVLAGFALSSSELRGRRVLTVFFLLGMTIPLHAIIIPQFVLMANLGMLNSLWSVIISLTALHVPFGVYLMRSFFMGLPRELGDAARVDGCNNWQVLRFIYAPIARPAIVALLVFVFLWSWNDLLVPLVYLTEEPKRTISVGLTLYQGRFTTDYALTAAGATIASLPVIIVFVLFQRHLMRGVTAGSLAGT